MKEPPNSKVFSICSRAYFLTLYGVRQYSALANVVVFAIADASF